MAKILGIDPGEKRTGLALSDETQTIANPAAVINEEARKDLAAKIIAFANENEVSTIIVGKALDMDGEVGFQARKAIRLADEIEKQSSFCVILWDESFSSSMAMRAQNDMRIKRKKKKKTLDAIAASIMLQSFLDADNDSRLSTT